MASKVIAERGPRVLVAVSDERGYILDRRTGRRSPELSLYSVLATGYWREPTDVAKHLQGQHEQKTHGRRGGGTAVTEPADDGWADRYPNGNAEVREAAVAYLADAGLPSLREHARQNLTATEGRALADAYDNATPSSDDLATREAYAAFADEIDAQHAALTEAGYQMLPWDQPGQPYANSAEMRADVADNKRLYYFRTEAGQPVHELLTPQTNDRFRAVHDLFGHAFGGNQFGPKGETNAFLDHSQMFSPAARRAMTTETLAQNAWFNFSRANEGLAVTERSFAEQKAVLLPESLYADLLSRRDASFRKAAEPGDVEPDSDDYGVCPCHRPPAQAPKPDPGKPAPSEPKPDASARDLPSFWQRVVKGSEA